MTRIENEHAVLVAPVPQSSGYVLAGGDCGYCCLAGILETSIQEAYVIVETRMPGGDWEQRASMCAWRWQFFLRSLGLPSKEFRPKHRYYKTGALPLPWDNMNWIDGVRDHLIAGRILVASIRFNRSPPAPPNQCGDTNHNVLITGYRERWVRHPTVAATSQVKEVQIACSVRGTYWIPWDDLLYWHGGYPAFPLSVLEVRSAVADGVRCDVSTENDTEES